MFSARYRESMWHRRCLAGPSDHTVHRSSPSLPLPPRTAALLPGEPDPVSLLFLSRVCRPAWDVTRVCARDSRCERARADTSSFASSLQTGSGGPPLFAHRVSSLRTRFISHRLLPFAFTLLSFFSFLQDTILKRVRNVEYKIKEIVCVYIYIV